MGRRRAYRARTAFYVAGTIIFLIAASVAVLFALGYRIDPIKLRAYKSGLIVLKSQPTGAYVTINNQLDSQRTSARLSKQPGEYEVKVDRPGALPWEKRLNVEPGQAVLEENILLFLSQPTERALTSDAAGTASLTPDGRQVVYIATESAQPVVKRHDMRNERNETVGLLPAGFQTGSLVPGPGAGRTIAQNGTAVAVVGSGLSQPITIPGVVAARFVPQSDARILIQSGNELAGVELTTGVRTPLASGITAWTTTSTATYVATATGELQRITPGGTPKPILSGHTFAELTPLGDGDRLLARTSDRELYLVSSDRAQLVANRIDRAAANPDAGVVVLASGGELTIWRQTDGDRRLVTRSSVPFDDLAVITDGHYLLYIQSGQIHAIASDGTNDRTLLPATGPLKLGIDTTLLRQSGQNVVSASLLAQ